MERYFYKCKPALKLIAVFSILFWALLFTSPAKAASRELNTPVNAVPTQVAYYGGYYHRGYRWNNGYRHYRHPGYRHYRHPGYRHYRHRGNRHWRR